MEAELPVLDDVSRGAPGERVAAAAVGHGDPVGANLHADPGRLVVDGDDAKVGADSVFVRLLGADQLAVHHNTCTQHGGEPQGCTNFMSAPKFSWNKNMLCLKTEITKIL